MDIAGIFLNFAVQYCFMRRFFSILMLISIFSCKQSEQPQKNAASTGIDTTSVDQKIKMPSQTIRLLPAASAYTSDWLGFVTAQEEIRNFENYSIKDVTSNAKPIVEIMKSMQESVPDTLKSIPVQARLTVLYTKAKVLEQLAARPEYKSKKIAEVAASIPSEFNNLKIQINELFLKTLEDFDNELDEFEARADSINNAIPNKYTTPKQRFQAKQDSLDNNQ